ncbi:AI-2E family transporter [Streptomyces sp. NPDC046759]|uniref:AI-2E family transporter n=1 Tax=Streptomyces sp. NPDC046759 TaxID=3155019 RepID=UPI0033ED6ADE
MPAGIGAIVFFIVYEQAENHLLQPVILSRTVKLNPLTVLLATLIAAEIAGIRSAAGAAHAGRKQPRGPDRSDARE